MLKFCYAWHYVRILNNGLEGQQLSNIIGVGFWSYLHSNHLQVPKGLPHSKEGAIYLLKSTHKSWNHNFVIFLGSFAIWGSCGTIVHLPHEFPPTSTCPTINSNGQCLGYATFECHSNFEINWESFPHTNQQKYMFGICCLLEWLDTPKLWRWQTSSKCLGTGFIVN